MFSAKELQVKEDVISRFGELGVKIDDGKISFDTSLLNFNEMLKTQEEFRFVGLNGNEQSIELRANQLAFTICQVPIVYTVGKSEELRISYNDGTLKEMKCCALDKETSTLVFARSGEIKRIEFITTN